MLFPRTGTAVYSYAQHFELPELCADEGAPVAAFSQHFSGDQLCVLQMGPHGRVFMEFRVVLYKKQGPAAGFWLTRFSPCHLGNTVLEAALPRQCGYFPSTRDPCG